MIQENAFGGRRIMVVEDDYLIVTELVEVLHAMGAEVIGPIPDTDKALERLGKLTGIAGAILDVNVQGKPVFPVAAELEHRGIPYVFSSGYDQDSIPPEFAHARHFTKPTPDEVIASALLGILEPQTHGDRSLGLAQPSMSNLG